ncbi:MAG TPA: YicC/YloC family endoribonuclease [Paracoccaceae bacterium]|nr:YicC/YloC family endoribonuclease [Paracoccaceae bacterium]
MQSMTGFAEVTGNDDSFAWRWEARGVNGRGLEMRLRLPDGCEALDPLIRARVSRRFGRGTIHLGLRLGRAAGAVLLRLEPPALAQAIEAVARAEEAATAAGLAVQPATADRILALSGVLAAQDTAEVLSEERRARFTAEIELLLDRLEAARREEGAALQAVLRAQLDQIGALAAEARETAEARSARTGALLRERVQALLGAGAPLDEARLAQELALIAVRADVTEELDRLGAHVAAARELLARTDPVGRRFDFLAQEFNREANTLCSKSGSAELTRVGLALKVVIDQMREQIQNVE